MKNPHGSKQLPFSLFGAVLLCLGLSTIGATQARANAPFYWGDKAIHPGCVHALVMNQGDAIPVTIGVSLEGCAASDRSKPPVTVENRLHSFEDDELLGGGSFGYIHISTLDNGIYILGIARKFSDGAERVSLAAVDLVQHRMMRQGAMVNRIIIELLGEMWIEDLYLASVRISGNIVRFRAGSGPTQVEKTVDLSRIRTRPLKK